MYCESRATTRGKNGGRGGIKVPITGSHSKGGRMKDWPDIRFDLEMVENSIVQASLAADS